jgi:hypothetical protein
VVSRSLDGKRGLLGEVKWSERAFRRADLGQIADSLRRKGVPPALAQVSKIVYCLFVPKAEVGSRELDGMSVVDAAAVAAAGT